MTYSLKNCTLTACFRVMQPTRPLFHPVRQLNLVCRVDAEEDIQDFSPLCPGLDSSEIVVLFLCPERDFHRSRHHSGKFLPDEVFLLFLLTERTASFHERCLYFVLPAVVSVLSTYIARISSDLFSHQHKTVSYASSRSASTKALHWTHWMTNYRLLMSTPGLLLHRRISSSGLPFSCSISFGQMSPMHIFRDIRTTFPPCAKNNLRPSFCLMLSLTRSKFSVISWRKQLLHPTQFAGRFCVFPDNS